MGKVIKEHSYKEMMPKFYSRDDHGKDAPLFGCEIEVDCGGEDDNIAQKCINILDPISAITKHDGSLTAGFEISIAPMTKKYYRENYSKFEELFKFLVSKGYRAHDTRTCGLHIHVNRESFGDTAMIRSENIAKVCWLVSMFRDYVIDFSRRESSYGRLPRPNTDWIGCEDLYQSYAVMRNIGKYAAVNMAHVGTYEFRMFKGTLNINTFYLCIDFVNCLVYAATTMSVDEIFGIRIERDFERLFTDEIREYVRVRREKYQKQHDDNYFYYADRNEALRDVYKSYMIMSQALANRSASHGRGTRVESISFDGRPQNSIQGIVSIDPCNYSEIREVSTESHPDEESDLDRIKRNIKSLKKKIKHSRIPLEKQQLQREYEETYREYKKLLKQERRRRNVND